MPEAAGVGSAARPLRLRQFPRWGGIGPDWITRDRETAGQLPAARRGGAAIRGVPRVDRAGLDHCPDYTDAEALAAITRMTGCSVRLLQCHFAQIASIMETNRLLTITREVVGTARENMVIGPLP